jgi:hypothetical protein
MSGSLEAAFEEQQQLPQAMRGRLVMGFLLDIMPGFSLARSLTKIADMVARILFSELERPISARSDDRIEHSLIAKGMTVRAPVAERIPCPLAYADTHLTNNRSEHPREAYHYSKILDEQVSHCILYDGLGPDARLIGVEYLVSDEVYRQMPAEEKLYWHEHKYEVDAGLRINPAQARFEERVTLGKVRILWSKTYHTWALGSDYPRGPSRFLWSDSGELPFVLPLGAEAQVSIP